jgi:predicted TIM-barrel enzyme
MARRYTRQELIPRLRAEIERGRPLVMTGAGNGIGAKFIERGGVDLLGVYNTSYLRMHGWASLAGMLPMGDANEIVYEVGRRHVLPQVREVPVIAGVNGVDLLRDMRLFLEDCVRIGYSGVHNFPTVGWFDGEFRATLEATGLGFEHEIRMLQTARELDMLTIGYAFTEEDTRTLMSEAAPDVFVFHAGITRGGATGCAGGSSMAETAARSQHHFAIARELKPDVILLGHGAGLAEPEDARYMLDHTDCQGIQLGSAIERLAIEEPLERRAAAFKQAMAQDGDAPVADRDAAPGGGA